MKNRLKKLGVIWLALIMILSVLPVSTLALSEGVETVETIKAETDSLAGISNISGWNIWGGYLAGGLPSAGQGGSHSGGFVPRPGVVRNNGGDGVMLVMMFCYVNYDLDDGDEIIRQKARRNRVLELPEDPEKEGYVFDGWYLDSEYTEEYDEEHIVTTGFKLYAKWVEEGTEVPEDDNSGVETETEAEAETEGEVETEVEADTEVEAETVVEVEAETESEKAETAEE